MKKITFFLLSILVSTIVFSQEVQYSIQLSSAGTLYDELVKTGNLSTITNLTLIGEMDARDFKTMKSSMTALTDIDMSDAEIIAYTGDGGTYSSSSFSYRANTIPESAFQYFYRLKKIILPKILTTIGSSAFNCCYNLTEISIPTSVNTLESSSFSGCKKMNNVYIPNNLVNIDKTALAGVNGLIEVDESNPNYSSQDGILYNKDKTILINCPISISGIVNLPNTVKTLGFGAFVDCENISEIYLPTSLKEIDHHAFLNCNGLSQITIPESVDIIHYNPFYDSPTFINVDENNKKYASTDGILYNKNKTILMACPTSITGTLTVPSTILELGYNSLLRNNLTGMILPEGLKTINAHCLGNGTLKTFNIPSTTTKIENYALYQAYSVECIKCDLNIPITLDAYSLDVNKNKCLLFVPAGTKALYEAAPIWKDFKNIIEGTGFGLMPTLSIEPTAGVSNFYIYSNTTCTITKNTEASWLTIDKNEISGDDLITITADNNTTSTSRTATITVSANGVQKQMVITQTTPYFFISSNSYNFTAEDSKIVTCTVNCNASWDYSTSNDWIHIERINNDLKISADTNPYAYPRYGTITLSSLGITKTISITQTVAPLIFNVSSESIKISRNEMSKETFTISSNGYWMINKSASWININKTSGNGDATIQVLCLSANNNNTPRTTNLIVRDNNNTISYTIEVTQLGLSTGNKDNLSTKISIFPNPTRDGFTINDLEQPSLMTIVNEKGQIIQTQQVKNLDYIPTSNFKPGIYFVQIDHQKIKLIIK